MTTDPSHQEHPSTYFVEDRSNEMEMLRLHLQDQFITQGMGGVLPEQEDPTRFRHVLDVACGTGGWLIKAAQTYPMITTLRGVDISKWIIDFARQQAEEQQVNDRVEFSIMDALRMLEFPDRQFDLINHRFGSSWLRTWDWQKLLSEYTRICQPGGTIRITDVDLRSSNNSPALDRLCELIVTAFFNAGHLFTQSGDGLLAHFPCLLAQHDIQQIQTHLSIVEYRAGTPEARLLAEDMSHLFRTTVPFLRKWTRLPDNYEEIYQQACTEMRQPTFAGQIKIFTTWGIWLPEGEA